MTHTFNTLFLFLGLVLLACGSETTTTLLTVSGVSPAPGQLGVPTDTPVELTFSQAVEKLEASQLTLIERDTSSDVKGTLDVGAGIDGLRVAP